MNHLAHFLLAPADDASRMGTLLGDFARGTDLSHWPAAVERAIRLHRRVDALTDGHPAVAAARRGLPAAYRRYGGILLDVYFDHLLLHSWARWHDQPLAAFAAATQAGLARLAVRLPPRAAAVAAGLAAHQGLLSCGTHAGMARVLARIGGRLSRPVALDAALPALTAAHPALEDAFHAFFPDLRAAAQAYLTASTLSTRPSALSVSR
ncbi:MAG: DUF479 domain-containing protein [Burkholderiales bacterium]|nr:DUF479 domain-containing protein [Burkholderiales bacterium]